MPGDLISPVIYPESPYFSDLGDSDPNEDNSALACFTDGSKRASSETGAGVHFPRGEISDLVKPLGRYSTVFQAEVLAIALAAEHLTRYLEHRSVENITFYSDSQAAINAVCSTRVRSATVKHCIDELRTLSTRSTIKLKWTKAHVGTVGNETADWLAKQGTVSPGIGPEPWLPVSYAYCKKQVWTWANNLQSSRWSELLTCRQSKELFRHPIETTGVSRLLQLTRQKLRITVQILTGHGNYGAHLKTIGRREDNTCTKCNLGIETREHIVEECPVYHNMRTSHFLSNIPCLTDIVSSRRFRQLAGFLDKAGSLGEINV